jgi:hypothetical protein
VVAHASIVGASPPACLECIGRIVPLPAVTGRVGVTVQANVWAKGRVLG